MSLSRELADDSDWRRPLAVYQSVIRDADVGMDVRRAVAAVARSGADTWILNAGGIRSYYPTALPFQTPSPVLQQRLSGDLFGDAVAAARSAGLRVLARLDMSKVSSEIAAEHPEWLYVSPDGLPQVAHGLHSACPSGDYYQQRTLDVIDEILARYDVDGFFFNYFTFNESDYDGNLHPPCHCDGCRERFAADEGAAALPTAFNEPGIMSWRRFTARVLAELSAKIVDHVGTVRPDAAVIIRRGAPIEYIEATNGARADRAGFWPFATGEAVSAHVSTRPQAPIVVGCPGFPDVSYRLAPEGGGHFAQSVAQTIARGGQPAAYVFGIPGGDGDDELECGYDLMRMRSRHADIYAALRPAAKILLVRPDGARPAADRDAAVEEFRGWYRALVEAHLPFDVLPLSALAHRTDPLSWAVVVLPDPGVLANDTVRCLDATITAGGTVVVSGSSAGSGGAQSLRGAARLSALGEPVVDAQLRGAYALRAEDHSSPEPPAAPRERTLLPVIGRYDPADWRSDARTHGRVVAGGLPGPPELIELGDRDLGPAHVVSSVDAGRIVDVPWTVGRAFARLQSDPLRRYMAGLIADGHDAVVHVDGSAAVEVVVATAGDRLVIHLLNHSGAGRRRYGAPARVGPVTLTIRGAAGSRAEDLRGGRQLRVADVAGDAVVEIDDIAVLDVVVVIPPVIVGERGDNR